MSAAVAASAATTAAEGLELNMRNALSLSFSLVLSALSL
jgi:hypothetical protein